MRLGLNLFKLFIKQSVSSLVKFNLIFVIILGC
ncbi:hypothetical protein L933_08455 [Helicobacter pylori PZ5056]|uniref:Uncharacterized protein n=1 Tax=Helicobacter pylori PZ5056 TaxID=1337393 RepID=T2SRF6_HELPX|nr:hypothetical protein L933_08455 [Helicobacter pylori PZ5056]